MARKPRICLANITYHVYSRCIEWRDMMSEDFFKDLFIEVLIKTQEKYDFELNFYEIMNNHFHLIIKTVEEGESISRIMQYIKSRFAERFNKITNRFGTFWSERFKDVIVEMQDNPLNYLLWLLWYLAFNPVRKYIVSDPRDYVYGCINSYLNENTKQPLKITLHEYFLLLGSSFKDCIGKFLFFEDAYRKRLSVIW